MPYSCLIARSMMLCLPVLMSACGSTSGTSSGSTQSAAAIVSSTSTTSSGSGGTNAATAAGDSAPIISGQPGLVVVVGNSYAFQAAASDPSGEALIFSISNLPKWATFDQYQGKLSGVPVVSDVGNYSGIVVEVSDGQKSAQLPPFSIAVTLKASAAAAVSAATTASATTAATGTTGNSAATTGAATISWLPPTQNTDGSALTDLAGYRVYYGTDSTNLADTAQITNPGIETYVVSNLSPGTWYFSVKAYTTANVESSFSGTVSKAIL